MSEERLGSISNKSKFQDYMCLRHLNMNNTVILVFQKKM